MLASVGAVSIVVLAGGLTYGGFMRWGDPESFLAGVCTALAVIVSGIVVMVMMGDGY